MASDPGDLVLDPTCGSGTTAHVAEQWGRRWITIDTSRVALTLARTRLMGGRFPYYLPMDSQEGQTKEAEITGKVAPTFKTENDIRKGFVYKRVPHVTLKSIANNPDIEGISARFDPEIDQYQSSLQSVTELVNKRSKGKKRLVIPETVEQVPAVLEEIFEPQQIKEAHEFIAAHKKNPQPKREDFASDEEFEDHLLDWGMVEVSPEIVYIDAWTNLKKLQAERRVAIDKAILKHADTELLFDQPYEDAKRVRVTGPFTVESLAPHRVLETEDALTPDPSPTGGRGEIERPDFATMILENLRKAGVQNSRKNEKLKFETLESFSGLYLHGRGSYNDAENGVKTVAVSIGPEFGTVGPDWIKEAAKEAVKGVGFDLLIVCGFSFDGYASEEAKQFGNLTVLPVRMNNDLSMSDELLKKTGAGNLFMVFGEPDITVHKEGNGQVSVEIRGLDVYDPTTGQIRSGSTDDLAVWFIDTNYNEESFFVRHAYFLGADDPYAKLKRALRAEIDEAAWSALYSTRSQPFDKPKTGKIAVKVINHYGDEVLKVYEV